jgi:hypothetical protein
MGGADTFDDITTDVATVAVQLTERDLGMSCAISFSESSGVDFPKT